MELRRLSICLSFFLMAAISQCSEARHARSRRASDYEASNEMMNDDSNDYGAQNDADGGEDENEATMEPAVMLSMPEHYALLIGKTVRLECKVSPKAGTVTSWTKDDGKIQISMGGAKTITSDRIILDSNSSDLVIKDLELSDTGRYTCTILQDNPVNVTHTIIVKEPPRVVDPETTTEFVDDNEINDNKPRIISFYADDYNPREGSGLLLTCDVSGTPKPSIIWSRQRKYGLDGTERLSEIHGEFSERTLFIKNVSENDSGAYYCYAVSDAGNATAMLTVTVYGKPRVDVHKTIINTDIGVEAELKCTVHSEAPAHMRWYKDGRLIEDATPEFSIKAEKSASTLTVTPKVDEDFGTYTCEAINTHGKHNKSIELVQSPVIEDLDVNGPKLTWTVHSHQPLEDIEVQLKSFGEDGGWTTFKVPLPENKEKAHKYDLIYVIDDKFLDAGTYEATVKVKNNKSWSHVDNPAVVKLDNQAQAIKTASVFRDGNGASKMQPMATVALSTALMYLLVRML